MSDPTTKTDRDGTKWERVGVDQLGNTVWVLADDETDEAEAGDPTTQPDTVEYGVAPDKLNTADVVTAQQLWDAIQPEFDPNDVWEYSEIGPLLRTFVAVLARRREEVSEDNAWLHNTLRDRETRLAEMEHALPQAVKAVDDAKAERDRYARLQVAAVAEQARLTVENERLRAELAEVQARANADLGQAATLPPHTDDPEDCGLCAHVHAVCPYHEGVERGAWLIGRLVSAAVDDGEVFGALWSALPARCRQGNASGTETAA